jgi:hypothetical protein
LKRKLFSAPFLVNILIAGLFLASAVNINVAQRNPNLFAISGYVFDSCGNPASGTYAYLINSAGSSFGSDVWVSPNGLYCLVAPAGTYTFVARGPNDSGTSFSETQIVVDRDLNKNITLVPGFKVSGYVVDSAGKGLAGSATFIFNSTWTVPSVTTGNSGFYAVYLPAGTYTFVIWPPYNSSLVNFQNRNFTVCSDMTYNVVLDSGFKLSGYLHYPSGEPVVGLSTLLINSAGFTFSAGRWSDSSGYYYGVVPAGTYSLYIHGSSSSGKSFSETSLAINSDITKNITIISGKPATG